MAKEVGVGDPILCTHQGAAIRLITARGGDNGRARETVHRLLAGACRSFAEGTPLTHDSPSVKALAQDGEVWTLFKHEVKMAFERMMGGIATMSLSIMNGFVHIATSKTAVVAA
jgi:hypothetical protein